VGREFYKVTEVAEKLGISRSSAYALVNSGELVSARIAGTIRIPAKALDDFVASVLPSDPLYAENIFYTDTDDEGRSVQLLVELPE
jgi:excisionase family DNA binding protein